MNKKQAFELCEKLNGPLYPIKPMYHAVYKEGKKYKVIHLPTKKEVRSNNGEIK